MSAGDAELELGLSPDVPLPFGDTPPPDVLQALDRARTDATLRTALADVLDAYESGRTLPAERVRAARQLVGRPAVVDEPATPQERRDEGIARAAAKWTDDEVRRVDLAIRTVALRAKCDAVVEEFTTADVWAELGPGFPVTKGIAGRMTAAKAAGLIANTGRTIIAPKDATGPNHGQRLTVWRAV